VRVRRRKRFHFDLLHGGEDKGGKKMGARGVVAKG
jgi:hypothetical protein